MNSGPLSDAEVEAQAGNFVAVRVDSDAREDLVRLLDVRDLPALIWFTPDGGVLARCTAVPQGPQDVLTQMKKALETFARLRKLEQAAAADPSSPKRLKALAEALYGVMLWDRSAETFERLLALGKPEFAESAREFRVYIDLMRGRHLEGLAAARAFEKDFPGHKDTPKIVYWRGLFLYRLGRRPEAIAAWEDVKARFPDDPQAKLAQEAIVRAKR